MAIFGQMTAKEFRQYTHKGIFCGLVPVYLKDIHTDEPTIAERNWCPEWWLSLVAEGWQWLIAIADLLAPGIEPGFPVTITEEIDHGPERTFSP